MLSKQTLKYMPNKKELGFNGGTKLGLERGLK